jgi:xanthine dehydrogenase molybdopterin-binding subunit B
LLVDDSKVFEGNPQFNHLLKTYALFFDLLEFALPIILNRVLSRERNNNFFYLKTPSALRPTNKMLISEFINLFWEAEPIRSVIARLWQGIIEWQKSIRCFEFNITCLENSSMSSIGQSAQRSDAFGKVTGQTLYPGDINLPDQVYMKILFAGRPHAIIRRINTSKAEALNGVLGVFTAKDVPINEYGLIMPDQPVLCGPGSDKPYADRVRFIGDQVALVVAESEELAAQACQLIKVDYEDLPVVTDPLEARKEGQTLLHPELDSNVFCHYQIRKGEVSAAFDQADVIVEQEYKTPSQEHAYLQPEAGLSYIDDEGRVTVEVAGQWTHEDQGQIAHALNLPKNQIRVIYPAIGGAFGGREDM